MSSQSLAQHATSSTFAAPAHGRLHGLIPFVHLAILLSRQLAASPFEVVDMRHAHTEIAVKVYYVENFTGLPHCYTGVAGLPVPIRNTWTPRCEQDDEAFHTVLGIYRKIRTAIVWQDREFLRRFDKSHDERDPSEALFTSTDNAHDLFRAWCHSDPIEQPLGFVEWASPRLMMLHDSEHPASWPRSKQDVARLVEPPLQLRTDGETAMTIHRLSHFISGHPRPYLAAVMWDDEPASAEPHAESGGPTESSIAELARSDGQPKTADAPQQAEAGEAEEGDKVSASTPAHEHDSPLAASLHAAEGGSAPSPRVAELTEDATLRDSALEEDSGSEGKTLAQSGTVSPAAVDQPEQDEPGKGSDKLEAPVPEENIGGDQTSKHDPTDTPPTTVEAGPIIDKRGAETIETQGEEAEATAETKSEDVHHGEPASADVSSVAAGDLSLDGSTTTATTATATSDACPASDPVSADGDKQIEGEGGEDSTKGGGGGGGAGPSLEDEKKADLLGPGPNMLFGEVPVRYRTHCS